MTARLLIGDVRERMAELPDGSVDLIVTSPPFLALRSYLPADHPDKAKEIGSEATPAQFLDTMLALTAEWRRLLAPHGSLCVELGDTYSGSGGGGGDYLPGGMREGQPGFGGSAEKQREGNAAHWRQKNQDPCGWPLAKSLTGIPTLYTWSLAYGRNLLRAPLSGRELVRLARNTVDDWHEQGIDMTARQLLGWMDDYLTAWEDAGPVREIVPWRIRNLLVWARPNPPVGALGDKFRPATSYITVACTEAKRWFDLDAVREPWTERSAANVGVSGFDAKAANGTDVDLARRANNRRRIEDTHAGAPPLDWHSDIDDGPNGDRLWWMTTAPYKGAHYATFPMELPQRLIKAMCPLRVCTVCGKPSERITSTEQADTGRTTNESKVRDRAESFAGTTYEKRTEAVVTTLGWTDCGHGDDAWRPGLVCDPFAGSGTTLAAAVGLGRDAIGIDLDETNADLVRERCGMFLEVGGAA